MEAADASVSLGAIPEKSGSAMAKMGAGAIIRIIAMGIKVRVFSV